MEFFFYTKQEIQQFYIDPYVFFDQISFQIVSIMKVRLTIYGCITRDIFIETMHYSSIFHLTAVSFESLASVTKSRIASWVKAESQCCRQLSLNQGTECVYSVYVSCNHPCMHTSDISCLIINSTAHPPTLIDFHPSSCKHVHLSSANK